jgi:hypothetical protein
MRTFTFIFIIIGICGCGERTTEQEITAFEQELGPQLSLELSNVIEHFERELNDRYSTSSTEQAYAEHLKFILASDGLTIDQWLPCQFRKDSIFRIYSAKLVDEIWIKPDSVWIQDSRIYTPYWDNSEPFGRKIQDWVTNYDSLIFTESNTENFNYRGKFLKAVQAISETNQLANWYYDIKSNAGTISPHISAQLILDNKNRNKISLEDYLVKRIILVETYAETCSNIR